MNDQEVSSLTDLSHEILESALSVGVDSSEKERSGTFMHIDQSTVFSQINERFQGQLEMMDTKEALEKYDWLEDYRWKLVDRDKDEYTKKVAERFSGGYFMRILPGAKIVFPLQSCLLITEKELEQRVHNIIIAEKDSEAHIITGCTLHPDVGKSSHLGISEFYIKEGATLNFTMIHNWNEETKVRPRSAAVIDDRGAFISNYLSLRPVKDMQMFPAAFCRGRGSRVSFNSILYASKGSHMDIGSKAVLEGSGSRAEMISRAITKDNSELIVRGIIDGKDPESMGHLECKGLLLDDSNLQSIPELIARRKGVEITHEAAVGKISDAEITYLMTRKMTRDEAVSMIIRGFMDVGIMGLPEKLENEINNIIDLTAEAG